MVVVEELSVATRTVAMRYSINHATLRGWEAPCRSNDSMSDGLVLIITNEYDASIYLCFGMLPPPFRFACANLHRQ